MTTSDNPWGRSSYINQAHVVHKPRNKHRHEKRLTGILRAEKVQFKPEPIEIGIKMEKIQVVPILKDGQVKALHATCPCGCESTFDIQYAAGGETK